MADEMLAEQADGTSWWTTLRPLPPSRSARSPRRSPAWALDQRDRVVPRAAAGPGAPGRR